MRDQVKKRILYTFLFPFLFCYYEVVFRLSTADGFWNISLIPTLLFSVCYGLAVYTLVSLVPAPKAKRAVTSFLIFLSAIPYLVEYFVYMKFKVFYDVNTVFGGAGDVMKSFTGDILHMIFSLDGVWKIFLFFLPFILYMILRNPSVNKRRVSWLTRFTLIAAAVIFFLAGLLVTYKVPVLKSSYKTEYNFQSAVGNFGLLSGIRLDIRQMISGDGNFEPVGKHVPKPEPQPKEYGYNQTDLRFKETSTEKIRDLNDYVKSLTPSHKNQYTGIFKGKNLILITAEAFSAEVIDPELTPALYRLAHKGINFTDYYQPATAGTTGGEYQNIFGMLPTDGGRSFKKTADHFNFYTMGTQLDRLGYFGMAYHNNTYTYYDRDKTHIHLGYSDGYMGYGNGMEKYVTDQWPQSDLEMMQGTLPLYIDRQPFNVYYMTVSGHCGYSRSGNSMTYKNWDQVADLNCSDTVKGYLAANLELEKAMAYLLDELTKKGIADDTVICLTNDHFPYGLDEKGRLGNMPYLSELYGYSVNNLFQRDHSALILWCGALERKPPVVVDSPSFSLDILPTLFNLFGIEYDSRLLPGRDVFSDAEPMVFNLNYDWKTEKGTYFSSSGKFYPAAGEENVSEEYIEGMKSIVRNKIHYCELALDNDYFRYLFE